MKLKRHSYGFENRTMLVAMLLWAGVAARAATTGVTVGDNYFSPSSVTINVDDSILWAWTGANQHSSTSRSGLWDTGLHGSSYTYSRTFTTAGSFPYYCTIHSGQTGTITVNQPGPIVAITSPANGVSLSAPATFYLTATASDSTGTVTNMEFFQSGNSLGKATGSPYSVLVSALGVGAYKFSVVATDTSRLTATNSITVKVIPDMVRPTVSIVWPAASQRVTNTLAPVVVRGKASDDAQVTNVFYRLNGEDWTQATTTNGWKNWSATITPQARTNVVRAYSMDATGNKSLTNSASFIFVVTNPLTLVTNGIGSVSGSFTGNLLEVGKGYTIAAVPGAGQIFSNWTGSISSSAATQRFVMQTNMLLVANFVPNPFPAIKGSYNGLFSQAERVQSRSGAFALSLSGRGAYTGNIRRGTNAYTFSGQFDAGGQSVTTVTVGGNLWTINMALQFGGSGKLTGFISAGGVEAGLLAYRSVFNAVTNPAVQYAGKYTVIVPGSDDPAAGPGGDSSMALTVGKGGNASISGLLADGASLVQVVPVSEDGAAPVYAPLYSGDGSVFSWLQFDTNIPAAGVQGEVSWIKPAKAGAQYYPAGFTNLATGVGARYVAVTNSRVVGITNGIVTFQATSLGGAFTNLVMLTESNRFVDKSTTNKLTLKVSVTNGVFSGSVRVPGTARTNAIRGAFLQDAGAGYGFYLGTNQSGRVVVERQ